MSTVVLVLHLLVAIVLIALVLMQRSEGGALGIGGGSSSLLSGRGAADVLARSTGALAILQREKRWRPAAQTCLRIIWRYRQIQMEKVHARQA